MSEVSLEVGDCLDVFGRQEPRSLDALIQDWPAGRDNAIDRPEDMAYNVAMGSKAFEPRSCMVCGASWTPTTRYQARRNVTCSRACAGRLISKANAGRGRMPDPICGECLKPFRPKSNVGPSKAKFCSTGCAARNRVKNPESVAHLAEIAKLGRDGWTIESETSYSAKMTGSRNPAWRGGSC